MNRNALIHWMAHAGQGSWASFKRAVAAVGNAAEAAVEPRRLRLRFSDLGFAEFFVDGTERWRAFRPLLATSPHQPTEAFLCGARTPRLTERLRKAAEQRDCLYVELVVDHSFTNVKIVGGQLADVARAAGVPFEPNIGRLLAADLVPLEAIIPAARRRSPPVGWRVRSFDFALGDWVDGSLPNTAIECTSRFEERTYFVRASGDDALELPKREAIYAAASLQNTNRDRRAAIRLAHYDVARQELTTPLSAPLPEAYARAACVSAGRPSVFRNKRIVYERVPPHLASVLLVSLDHLPPLFHRCAGRRPGSR
jgi:hypothetical protein